MHTATPFSCFGICILFLGGYAYILLLCMLQWCHRLFVLYPADDGQQARNSCTGLHIQFLGPHDLISLETIYNIVENLDI